MFSLENNMTPTEKTAIAILKSGRSFDEASQVTGIPVDKLFQIWKTTTNKK
jgi:hypothetical protein